MSVIRGSSTIPVIRGSSIIHVIRGSSTMYVIRGRSTIHVIRGTQPDSHYIGHTAASVLKRTTLSTPEGHWLMCAC